MRARSWKCVVGGIVAIVSSMIVVGPLEPAAVTAAPTTALGGDYNVAYGTAGAVTIHVSGDTYTVSVKTPFRTETGSCDLLPDAVLATFTGTGTHFSGVHYIFNNTTCLATGGGNSVTADLNSDGSVNLGSQSGLHLLTKVADTVAVAAVVGGDYSLTYATPGVVSVHVSGDVYTVSVKTPFKTETGSCNLLAANVPATFTGAGPHFSGVHYIFNNSTCLDSGGGNSISAYLNSDNTITLGSQSGYHLLTKVADTVAVAAVVGGDYSLTYATPGVVSVHVSGDVYTVSVKTPFKTETGSCNLLAANVPATFTGAGPHFSGVHYIFNNSTCLDSGGGNSISAYLNSDNTITLGSQSGYHLLTKVADTVAVAAVVGGDYSLTYATPGVVSVHVSGDVYTVSVKTPFKTETGSCNLLAANVPATFTGAGPHFSGVHYIFNNSTCLDSGGGNSISAYLNSDNTITLGSQSGYHLLTKVADTVAVAAVVGGDYSLTYATPGVVSVHVSGDVYTVSVKTPFKTETGSCNLLAANVPATFTGAGPHFSGVHYIFNNSTCLDSGGGNSISAYLNSDNTITLGSQSGYHLLTRIAGTVPVGPVDDLGFASLQPARLLDTRAGESTIDGQFAGVGAVGARASLDLTVVGRGGVPASGVGAVVLNVTATAPTSAGYVTVYPTGTTPPTASNLNFVAGLTTPNLVIAKVGAGGKVSLFNSAGSTHLIADVVGWFPATSSFASLQPARLLDTRAGESTIDGQFAGVGAVGARASLDLTVVGRGGVPASGVGAVVLNVTATAPTSAGYVTVYPTGTTPPTASNLNFVAGLTTPNLVIAKVGAGGKVSLFNSAGSTHLIADVVGWFPATSSFASLQPARLLDTRAGESTIDGQFAGVGAVGARASLDLTVVGRGGVPASGVGAVVLNVTATAPTSAGYVTVYPTGTTPPTASNLNFVAGLTTPNLVIAKVGAGGKVSLFNSAGSTHLIADVVGWFPATSSVASPVLGEYSTTYASAGRVTVQIAANKYTVSVSSPFTLEGASCSVPAGTILATFSGVGPHFSGVHYIINSSTCVTTGGANSVAVHVNTDGTISLGSQTGFHLLTHV